ncbi:sulfotransferase domain-containing protein [Alloalcanivorax sp. C16-2]|uniref:sulfotransferase domain-containing protein n=1 Tax=Alloalcanivorax sp. C16-2 TaxID=3390052 RepID=UPI003970F3EC
MNAEKLFSPDFFIAGFPKCGTTSLHDFLAKQVEVDMSSVKEPHYFAPDIEWYKEKRISKESSYKELFKNDHSVLRGESSTWYLHSECAVSEIQRINPAAKYVVCIRKPSSAIKSLITHRIYSGRERHSSVAAVLNDAESRKFYFESYDYQKILDRFLEKVERENVYFVLFDDLISDCLRVELGLVDFLGLCHPVGNNHIGRKNESKVGRPLVIQKLVSLVPLKVKMFFLRVFGEKFRSFFWRGAKKFSDGETNKSMNIDDDVNRDLLKKDLLAKEYLASLGVNCDRW